MTNAMCGVDECTKHGEIELVFPPTVSERTSPSEDPGSADHVPHVTMICRYHANKAVEMMAEMGHVIDINLTTPKRTFGRESRIPDLRRYLRRKPHDNTEHEG